MGPLRRNRNIYKCCYAYSNRPAILSAPGVKASDLVEILETHIAEIRGLTYTEKIEEIEIYNEVIYRCGDFYISKDWVKKYKKTDELCIRNIVIMAIIILILYIAVLFIYELVTGVTPPSDIPYLKPVVSTTLFVFFIRCVKLLWISETCKLKYKTVIDLNICVIHALEQKQARGKTKILNTVDKIINHMP